VLQDVLPREEEADSDNIPRHISCEFTSHVCELPPALTYHSLERENFDDIVLRLEKTTGEWSTNSPSSSKRISSDGATSDSIDRD